MTINSNLTCTFHPHHLFISGIKPAREKGPDTVLCLDTSKSMAGQPFEQMIAMALDIVNGKLLKGIRIILLEIS